MNKHPYDIIKSPVVTEKAGEAKDRANKVTFCVDPRANKIEIKKAVEQVFKVKVQRVNVINVPGKPKRLGRHAGRRPDWKKAIVTLAEGSTIEVFDMV